MPTLTIPLAEEPTAETIRLARLGTEGLVIDRAKHYVAADLEPLGEVLAPRYEIIDGTLFVSPAPHLNFHQHPLGELYFQLRLWLAAHPIGTVFLSPVDVVFSEDETVIPDLVFLSAEKAARATGRAIEEVPDLLVEFLSPSTAWYDRTLKRDLFEKHSVTEYWIVDARARTVAQYRLRDGAYGAPTVLHATDVLRSGVLPGFEVEVGTFLSEAG
ncbi:MAG: Uma2 family endonuclease [Bacteroidota bacterium]